MDRIYKIALIGTRTLTVEQAPDWRAACYAAGWPPESCDAVDITDDLRRDLASGKVEIRCAFCDATIEPGAAHVCQMEVRRAARS